MCNYCHSQDSRYLGHPNGFLVPLCSPFLPYCLRQITIDLLSVIIGWFAFSRTLFKWKHALHTHSVGLFSLTYFEVHASCYVSIVHFF